MNLDVIKKASLPLYILILVILGFYVHSVLKVKDISLSEKKDKEVTEIKPADVSLVLDLGADEKTYKIRLRNVDSVGDLLAELRRKQNLTYEKTEYSYGTVITQVNNIEPMDNQRWRIFAEGVDITDNINYLSLKDNGTYTVALVDK